MPNLLDATGLQTASRAELVAYYTAKYQEIYGADINLDSDTPDGQMMNIFIQSVLDLEDLLVQIYNTFDPDNAVGVVLDQRVAINGIQRLAGTNTVTNITVVTSQSVNLYGIDQDAQEVFTVADNAGTKWVLQDTQLGVTAGTHVYSFQALLPGATLTVPNTITVPVTIVLGVTSVNNPTTYTTLGINEETDAVLKVRRQQSVSYASQGYLSGLLGALENIEGMESAFVYENNTGTTDSDGIPGHSIWVIVAGTAADADIAQAIYEKRNAGCGMKGDTTYDITQVDGTIFTVRWDTVTYENLYIFFVAQAIDGVTQPNLGAIVEGLPTTFVPTVNGEVNTTALGTQIQAIDPNAVLAGVGGGSGNGQGFSLARTQIIAGLSFAASGSFAVSYNGNASALINWNDSAVTVASKIHAVTGLSGTTVTGRPIDDAISIVFHSNVLSLITVTSNTLVTGGAAPVIPVMDIVDSASDWFTPVLTPSTKLNQFLVTSENIIARFRLVSAGDGAIQLLPTSTVVVHAETTVFAAAGGYGPYVYTISVNNSGGSINASTGLYTAGAVTGVIDTIKVTDALFETQTATVSVI